MARKPHGAFYELLACHSAQASQVFANTLQLDHIYTQYLLHNPASKAGDKLLRGHSDIHRSMSDALSGIDTLRIAVDELQAHADALLADAGTLDLSAFARRRAGLEAEFGSLMKLAGVVHDHVLAAASMAMPDMTRARRRPEVTDELAALTVWRLGHVVSHGLAAIEPETTTPALVLDYRHSTSVTNETKGFATFLKVPFWTIYMPRVGAGVIAHECAHRKARALVKHEMERSGSAFGAALHELRELMLPQFLVRQDASGADTDPLVQEQTYNSLRAGLPVRIAEEFVSDALAALILGPAYIVNMGEFLTGTRPLADRGRLRLDYVPHSVRFRLLLKLYEADLLRSTAPAPSFLLEQLDATIAEYRRSNLSIPHRNSWMEFQDLLLSVLTHGFTSFISEYVEHPSIIRAREQHDIQAYGRVWSEVDDICRDNNEQARGPHELLQALRRLDEIRHFVDESSEHDPGDEAQERARLDTREGESWSLDWFWLRAASPPDTPRYDELLTWMRSIAPASTPTESNSYEIGGFYGLVLGASDGVILRPGAHVREPANLVAEITRGLAVNVERRILLEVRRVSFPGAHEDWLPRSQWDRVACITEVRLSNGRAEAAAFLEDLVLTHGVRPIRIFCSLGWAQLVLLLAQEHVVGSSRWNWSSTRSGGEHALQRAVSTLIGVCHAHGVSQGNILTSPWTPDRSISLRVTSLIRVRQASDAFNLREQRVDRTPRPIISPIIGPYDAQATWELGCPTELDQVLRWTYARTISGEVTRSVSVVPIEHRDHEP